MESGFLLVDKPAGWTSHDVVAKLRGLTGIRRIGHGGTLDPLATGLLVVGIGTATKQLEQFVQGDKTYLATVRLGATSTTDDAEGELTLVSFPPKRESDPSIGSRAGSRPREDDIRTALKALTGPQEQLPPVYSAIKTGGKKAYVEARAGRAVAREPRPVTIRAIDLVSFTWPEVTIRTTVSKGTYIRALARDLGERLGCGGYLTVLRREAVGEWSVAEAQTLDQLSTDWRRQLRPAEVV